MLCRENVANRLGHVVVVVGVISPLHTLDVPLSSSAACRSSIPPTWLRTRAWSKHISNELSWICLRCLCKVQTIIPKGGLRVINLSRKVKSAFKKQVAGKLEVVHSLVRTNNDDESHNLYSLPIAVHTTLGQNRQYLVFRLFCCCCCCSCCCSCSCSCSCCCCCCCCCCVCCCVCCCLLCLLLFVVFVVVCCLLVSGCWLFVDVLECPRKLVNGW